MTAQQDISTAIDPEYPESDPETPGERFRQLTDTAGVGDVTAFRQVLSESKWWDAHHARQIEAATLAYRDADIAALTSLNVGKALSGDNEYVRLIGGGDMRVLFNPWDMMRVPRYTISHADACADVMGVPLNSPDRHGAMYWLALDKVLKNASGDTYVSPAAVEKALREMPGAMSGVLTSTIGKLRSLAGRESVKDGTTVRELQKLAAGNRETASKLKATIEGLKELPGGESVKDATTLKQLRSIANREFDVETIMQDLESAGRITTFDVNTLLGGGA